MDECIYMRNAVSRVRWCAFRWRLRRRDGCCVFFFPSEKARIFVKDEEVERREAVMGGGVD